MIYILFKKINELKNKIKKPKNIKTDYIINLDDDKQEDITINEQYISSEQTELNKLRIKIITLMNNINKNL